jgi:hypothetical protein
MRRLDLVADCGSCAAICCIATSFSLSEDFALDKPAGEPCPYVTRDCRCAIHAELAERGMRGCAVYDCHGAGPHVTRTYAPDERDAAFLILRVVHELLWLVTEALPLCPTTELRAELAAEAATLDALRVLPLVALHDLDLDTHDRRARALLRRVGAALGTRRRARGLVVRR